MASRWKISVGPHGATVMARERKQGGNVYLYAYDPKLGDRRKRSLGFPVRDAEGKLVEANVEKAKRKAVELSNRLLRGETPGERLTVQKLFKLFRREVTPDHSESHRKDTERALEAWERYLGSRYLVSRFGPKEWNGFRRDRASGKIDARGRRVSSHAECPECAQEDDGCPRCDGSGSVDPRSPVGPRTVAKQMKTFRHACRFATTYRTTDGSFLLDVDPTRGLEIPKEKDPKRPVCDDDRYEALLEVADAVRMERGEDPARSYLRELLVLAAETGARIGAIVRLRWSDWLPDEATYGALRWRAEGDKSGRSRVVPVTPEVRSVLERHRQRRPGVGEAWMFPAPRSDGHVRVDVTRNWLRRAETKAELDHPDRFGWHAFRRMWATKRKHLSLKDVALAGGWADTQTLERCYQHADPETLEEVVLERRRLRMDGDRPS